MIDLYLAVTRGEGNRLGVDPMARSLYEGTFSELQPIIGQLSNAELELPVLEITYTPFMHAETVRFGARRYLIYDKYLGQVLNRLNRLVFDDSPPSEVDAYLAKIVALRLLSAGRATRALGYALVHHALREHLTRADSSRTQSYQLYTAMQEAFVLSHEVIHTAYDRHDDERASWVRWCESGANNWASMSAARYLSGQETWPAFGEEMAERIARDVESAYERRHGAIPEVRPEERERLRQWALRDLRPGDRDHYKREIQMVMQSPRVLEECVCDQLAARVVVAWAGIRLGVAPEVALAACFLALHHLRLLRQIDVIASLGVDDVGGGDRAVERAHEETDRRLHFFRYAAAGRLAAELSPHQSQELSRYLRESNEAHSRIIGDQLLLHLLHSGNMYAEYLDELRSQGVFERVLAANPDAYQLTLLYCNILPMGGRL